jgi:hypothetical protein
MFVANPPEQDDQLRELAEKTVCPNCGSTIKEGTRQLYGRLAFCSLVCVAQFNAAELIERHRRVVAALERHRKS